MSLLVVLRHVAVGLLDSVAIGTQNLKAFWKAVFLQPAVAWSATFSNLSSVRCPVVVHVVDLQAIDSILAALAPVATVRSKHLISELLMPVPGILLTHRTRDMPRAKPSFSATTAEAPSFAICF